MLELGLTKQTCINEPQKVFKIQPPAEGITIYKISCLTHSGLVERARHAFIGVAVQLLDNAVHRSLKIV